MPDTMNRALAVSEYLRREEDSAVRHEYVSGELFALAGVTRSHNRIAMNIASAVFAVTRARAGCETFVADVLLQAAEDVFYYPDVMVSCERARGSDRIVREPSVVVEITSPRTGVIDHREKLAAYRKISSLRSYLIVEQSRRSVERHWRDERGDWWSETVVGDGMVPIAVLDLELSLSEIYEGVEFGDE
jgi:Uma2 family endonuclease